MNRSRNGSVKETGESEESRNGSVKDRRKKKSQMNKKSDTEERIDNNGRGFDSNGK